MYFQVIEKVEAPATENGTAEVIATNGDATEKVAKVEE